MRKINIFTLIELLLVVSIIVLLMSMLLPALKKSRETAKAISCASKYKQIGLLLSMYNMDNDNYEIRDVDWVDPAWYQRTWAEFIAYNYLSNMTTITSTGVLVKPWDINNVFVCPTMALQIPDPPLADGFGYYTHSSTKPMYTTAGVNNILSKKKFTNFYHSPSQIVRATTNGFFVNGYTTSVGWLELVYPHAGKSNVLFCDGSVSIRKGPFPALDGTPVGSAERIFWGRE